MAKVGQPKSLTFDEVTIIRNELNNENMEALASRYGVHKATIRNAAIGNPPYDGLLDPPPLKTIPRQKPKRRSDTIKLTKAFVKKVRDMRQKLNNDSSLMAEYIDEMQLDKRAGANTICSEIFGISNSYVSRICNGHYDDTV